MQTGMQIGAHASQFAEQFPYVYGIKFNCKSIQLKKAWKSGMHQTSFTKRRAVVEKPVTQLLSLCAWESVPLAHSAALLVQAWPGVL